MKQILWLNGIIHQKSTSYTPQTQGLVEKMNRTVTSALAMYCSSKQNDWGNCIQLCVFAINTPVQDITKSTPYYSVYGGQVVLPTKIAQTNLKNKRDDGINLENYTVKLTDALKTLVKLLRLEPRKWE